MIKSSRNILVIDSKKSELKKVESFLKEIFAKYGLPIDHLNKVFLCVSEAVINSIEHGHKHDANKKIKVQVRLKNHDVSIIITDEGEGFDFKAIADPTEIHNLKKESGRGIHIIRSICDVLKYNEKGNSIQFQIKCS